MDWQPIASAPKDGTRVLLLRRQKVTGPTLTKNPVIGSWAAKRGYRAYWSLEITCNNYWAGDADLLGWMPLPLIVQQIQEYPTTASDWRLSSSAPSYRNETSSSSPQ